MSEKETTPTESPFVFGGILFGMFEPFDGGYEEASAIEHEAQGARATADALARATERTTEGNA